MKSKVSTAIFLTGSQIKLNKKTIANFKLFNDVKSKAINKLFIDYFTLFHFG